jgi:hypothetical protein
MQFQVIEIRIQHDPIYDDDQATFLCTKLLGMRNQQNPERSLSPLTKEEIKNILLTENQKSFANAKSNFLHTFIPMSLALGLEWYGATTVPSIAKIGGLICLGAEMLYIGFLTQIVPGQIEETSQELADSAVRLGIKK